jgi:hypothetical protein
MTQRRSDVFSSRCVRSRPTSRKDASLVAAAGSALVVAAPSALIEVVAWATLGAGLAAIAPTLFGAAPAVSATSPPVAIPAIATWGYLGSFTGPPLIGALAQ